MNKKNRNYSPKRSIRRMFIELALTLMSEGGHFGKPENNFKLSVIKKYVRVEEFNNRY